MKETLEKLVTQESLSYDLTHQTMLKIGQGECDVAEISAFLTSYEFRHPTLEEFIALIDALKKLVKVTPLKPHQSSVLMDVCGTGGDGKSTFNISTAASFVLADCGVDVAKHGNYAVSSSCGSSNVLESLGVLLDNDTSYLQNCLNKAGLCFMHAPLFHPAMKYVAPVRKALKIKTIFNLIGPLVNPAQVKVQVTGVYSLATQRLYQYFFQNQAQTTFSIVYGLEGYDEVTLDGEVKVCSDVLESVYDSEDFGFEAVKSDNLKAKESPAKNAELLVKLLEGRADSVENQQKTRVIAANAGLGLQTAYRSQGRFKSLKECSLKAYEKLQSGSPKKVLDKLLAVHQS